MAIVTPYHHSELSKKEQVRLMFNNIAHRYDFLNHFFSLGIDRYWRKKAIDFLQDEKPATILDVATGTADFAIEALVLCPKSITGIDISEQMLEIARKKIEKIKSGTIFELITGDSENLNFSKESFDAITVGFGIRNFENPEKGLSEFYRVLKKDGTLVVLEFSSPQKFPVKQFYHFYSNTILPFFGKIISKDKRAYCYLPESVNAFPSGQNFIKMLEKQGFINTKCVPLSFGIASIYIGKK